MRIEGQFEFDGTSPLAVWSFLTDANRIAQCLPGCEKLGVAVTNLAREHPGWEVWGGGESRLAPGGA